MLVGFAVIQVTSNLKNLTLSIWNKKFCNFLKSFVIFSCGQ